MVDNITNHNNEPGAESQNSKRRDDNDRRNLGS